jgi:hypothetical protein
MTFDFGAGPVPAHQHTNGGGWVAETAHVAARAYVGPQARIAGGTIHGGTIHGGTTWGGTIHGGTIRGGTTWGGTIHGGTIHGGTTHGGTIHGGTIHGGTIHGGTIWGGDIHGGTIHGGTIWGGTIRGGTIHCGTIWGGDIWGGTIWSTRDIMATGPVGSENQLVTLVRDGDSHLLGVGCWHGHNIDELAAEVVKRCPERAAEYAAVETLLRHRLAEWGQS